MLISRLGIDDSTYREMLANYGYTSSKNMEYNQASDLIKRLEADAVALNLWKKLPLKYEDCADREDMATPSQLRYIMGLWREDNYNHDKETLSKLRELLDTKFKLHDTKFLTKKRASDVIFVIKKMKQYYKNKSVAAQT